MVKAIALRLSHPTLFQTTANSIDTTEACLARFCGQKPESEPLCCHSFRRIRQSDEARFIVRRSSRFGITAILSLKWETSYEDAGCLYFLTA